eukprot:Skav220409  [mRNA]  locus=scaffold639:451831:462359:- [translate_table: standard]
MKSWRFGSVVLLFPSIATAAICGNWNESDCSLAWYGSAWENDTCIMTSNCSGVGITSVDIDSNDSNDSNSHWPQFLRASGHRANWWLVDAAQKHLLHLNILTSSNPSQSISDARGATGLLGTVLLVSVLSA